MANEQFPYLVAMEMLIRRVFREELDSFSLYSNSTDRILTRSDVMKMLDLGSTTIWKRMKDGSLPYFKVGRKVYFYESDVQAALKNSQ